VVDAVRCKLRLRARRSVRALHVIEAERAQQYGSREPKTPAATDLPSFGTSHRHNNYWIRRCRANIATLGPRPSRARISAAHSGRAAKRAAIRERARPHFAYGNPILAVRGDVVVRLHDLRQLIAIWFLLGAPSLFAGGRARRAREASSG
jgi:hypothetical protein